MYDNGFKILGYFLCQCIGSYEKDRRKQKHVSKKSLKKEEQKRNDRNVEEGLIENK